jgi:hypothetical protein
MCQSVLSEVNLLSNLNVRVQSVLSFLAIALISFGSVMAQEEKRVPTEEEQLEKSRGIAARELMKLSSSLGPADLVRMFEPAHTRWAESALAQVRKRLASLLKEDKAKKPKIRIASERAKAKKKKAAELKVTRKRIAKLTVEVSDKRLSKVQKKIAQNLVNPDFIKHFDRLTPREESWLILP